MTQAIWGHLFETGGQTILPFKDFTHLSQVIGPFKSKALSSVLPITFVILKSQLLASFFKFHFL